MLPCCSIRIRARTAPMIKPIPTAAAPEAPFHAAKSAIIFASPAPAIPKEKKGNAAADDNKKMAINSNPRPDITLSENAAASPIKTAQLGILYLTVSSIAQTANITPINVLK